MNNIINFRLISGFAAALILTISVDVSAETIDWKEDAKLHDGRTIVVSLQASDRLYNASISFLSPFHFKSTGFNIFRVEFRHPETNERIVWEGLPGFYPLLIDVINGKPFLVLSGRPNRDESSVYGCPELPYIYLSYTGFDWKSVSVEQAPVELVNANISAYRVWKGYEGTHYSTQQVAELIAEREQRSEGLMQAGIPRSYGDWYKSYEARFSRQFGDCRPPPQAPAPDPQFEASIEKSLAAQSSAQVATAYITNKVEKPASVSATEYSVGMGQWTGSAYLLPTCQGIIESVFQIRKYEYDEKGGERKIRGYTLITPDKLRIPIAENVKSDFAFGTQLQSVTCNTDSILAVARLDKNNLLIHRFRNSGEVIDVLKIELSDVEKVITGNGWGYLWGVKSGRNWLTFDIANYSYAGTANQGGSIQSRQTYRVELP